MQRVAYSGWGNIKWLVTNRVLQGSISGPVLFNIFVNNLDAGLEVILSNFARGAKLGGAVDSLKGSIAGLMQDLKNTIKFNNKSIFGSKFWNKAFLILLSGDQW